MTLADVELPITLAWGRAHAMIFSQDIAGRLAAVHSQHGTNNCVCAPRATIDGRMVLSADLLTEVLPGGLLHAMWEAADKTVLLPAVQVISLAEALALLPEQPSPE